MTEATHKTPETMTPEELIAKFESDIVYDCHGFTARFGRSKVQQELTRRGKEALEPIIKHLRAHPPGSFMKLNIAWTSLLNRIDVNIGGEEIPPHSLEDVSGWVDWAERVIMPLAPSAEQSAET